MIESDIKAVRRGSSLNHVIASAKLTQVGAGAETAGFARADNDAPHRMRMKPPRELAKFVDRPVGEDVHCPARAVENKMNQSARLRFEAELGKRDGAVEHSGANRAIEGSETYRVAPLERQDFAGFVGGCRLEAEALDNLTNAPNLRGVGLGKLVTSKPE